MLVDHTVMLAIARTALTGFAAVLLWAFIACVLEDTSYED